MIRAKVAVAYLILLSAVAGCAPTHVWIKTGATQQDFATDSYECERDARQSGYFGGGLIGALNMQQFTQRCMVARGWRQQGSAEGSAAPAPPSFTSEQWENGRRECLAQVRASGENDFSGAFNRCMIAKGL